MIWLPFYIEIFNYDLCDTRIVANGGQGKPAAYINHTHLKKDKKETKLIFCF